jgi:hypothetical protein
MSTPWYTIFGPRSWPGVEINTGNKKIDAVYYNLLSNNNVQLAASGVMWLVAGTGIRMITPGYVDVSGLRAHTLLFKDSKRIDNSGNIIPTYSGSIGSVAYKYDDHNLAGIPSDELVYNSGLGKLTMPSKDIGLLYVSRGNVDDGAAPTKEFGSFSDIVPVPRKVITSTEPGVPPTIIPSYVAVNTHAIFSSGVSIYPNLESYKGSILTHMGSGNKVEWTSAPYLKADGATWTRFPKRPIYIDGDRVIFYTTRPSWAQDWVNSPTLESLATEFGNGEDTIELITSLDRSVTHVKFATTILYGVGDVQSGDGPDLLTPLNSLFTPVTFTDPDETDPDAPQAAGYAVKICSPKPWDGSSSKVDVNGYAFSVTKGAYLSMQLSPDATDRFNCIDNFPNSPFRFKPSTSNNISIRPNVNTGFNLLAENIDFMVFGQRKTSFNNYEEGVFGLDNSLTPTGLTPAFKVDANIPNAASGSIESGIYYIKYLDRARLNPSGWNYDTNPKITINANSAHRISSLATGINTGLGLYADLTVSGITYSTQVMADKIFLNPKPTDDNSSIYIANSLLTLDRSGRIISRIPRQNPTVPSAPSGIRLDPGHTNGIGNTEVSLVWTAPESDGRSALLDYVLQFSSNNGETWTDLPNNLYSIDRASDITPLATIVGLSPLVSYRFRVAAQNGIGLGDYSNASTSITPGSEVPKRPDSLVASRAFDETLYSNITLSWDAPQAGADDVLGYVIEESTDNGATWQYYNLLTALISSTSELISGTESALDYAYRVSAWNSYGQSAFSYVYVQGNVIDEVDPEEAARQEEKANDVLSNWDFGKVLFTGVCPT